MSGGLCFIMGNDGVSSTFGAFLTDASRGIGGGFRIQDASRKVWWIVWIPHADHHESSASIREDLRHLSDFQALDHTMCSVLQGGDCKLEGLRTLCRSATTPSTIEHRPSQKAGGGQQRNGPIVPKKGSATNMSH